MKRLALVFAWWFFYSYPHWGSATVGPFRSQEDCASVRAALKSGAVTQCWWDGK